jgi:hypothetical protein
MAYAAISRSVLKERQRVKPARKDGRRCLRGKMPLGESMNLAVPGLELRVVADPAPEIGMPAEAVALTTFSS